ncbi:hypothetical protein O206_19950 [Ochrobactrum sp. EGD-AQ16]|nr:hypothetical protein O206_19950 [Ochrobactrum sp. EGD-AQ16]
MKLPIFARGMVQNRFREGYGYDTVNSLDLILPFL